MSGRPLFVVCHFSVLSPAMPDTRKVSLPPSSRIDLDRYRSAPNFKAGDQVHWPFSPIWVVLTSRSTEMLAISGTKEFAVKPVTRPLVAVTLLQRPSVYAG